MNAPLDNPRPAGPPRVRFTPLSTFLVRLALLGAVLTVTAAGVTVFAYFHSPYWDRRTLAPDQPVLFSHRHHAGELRIDCRYCHTGVETGAAAGLPSTQTCLNCHSQLFLDAPMLAPVHRSAATNTPIAWTRVNTLPEHVQFNHSAHIAKGIACASCHGDVADMALLAKARALTMRECLECHRNPGPHRVAADAITARSPPPDPAVAADPVETGPLTNCSTCHH